MQGSYLDLITYLQPRDFISQENCISSRCKTEKVELQVNQTYINAKLINEMKAFDTNRKRTSITLKSAILLIQSVLVNKRHIILNLIRKNM